MDGITYYKLKSPYEGDITKNCSLTGAEIDRNNLVLEGRDVKEMYVDGKYLVVTRFNGEVFKVEIVGAGSDCGSCLIAGQGINEESLEQNVIEATGQAGTTKVITVAGQHGGYNDGDEIPISTGVEDIIEKMLNPVYDVYAELPQSTIVYDGDRIFEVGSNNTFVMSHAYTDGYFYGDPEAEVRAKDSEGEYIVDPTDPSGYLIYNNYRLNAECPEVETNFYANGSTSEAVATQFLEDENVSVERLNMQEGSYSFGSKTTYNNNTQTPLKSNGTDSAVTIVSGETPLSSFSYNVRYKYYYGYTATHPDDNYNNVFEDKDDLIDNLSFDYIVPNRATVIPTMESSASKPALVLALPAPYANITKTQNSLGADVNVSEKWKKRLPEITYTNGGTTTIYKVYILHSLYEILYKNITFEPVTS